MFTDEAGILQAAAVFALNSIERKSGSEDPKDHDPGLQMISILKSFAAAGLISHGLVPRSKE